MPKNPFEGLEFYESIKLAEKMNIQRYTPIESKINAADRVAEALSWLLAAPYDSCPYDPATTHTKAAQRLKDYRKLV